MAKHRSKIKGGGGYPMGPWPENRGGEGGTPWARGLKTRGGGILGILGRLKVFWGPSWGHLGAVLGRLGAVLEPSWGRFGPSWRRLGPSWGVLGPSWSRLGTVLSRLGSVWGRLAASWSVLGPSWDVLGAVLFFLPIFVRFALRKSIPELLKNH